MAFQPIHDTVKKMVAVLSEKIKPAKDIQDISLKDFVMELSQLNPKISDELTNSYTKRSLKKSLKYDLGLTSREIECLITKVEKRFAISFSQSDYRVFGKTGIRIVQLFYRCKIAASRSELAHLSGSTVATQN